MGILSIYLWSTIYLLEMVKQWQTMNESSFADYPIPSGNWSVYVLTHEENILLVVFAMATVGR